ncbi:MAG: glycerate kinase [Luteolibacter sp.]
MPLRILIAPDKFKGSLTAREAAEAMRQGFAQIFPNAEFECVPVADGGEGLLDAFREAVGGKIHQVQTRDALGREVEAEFLLTGQFAIIESSQANGIWRLAPDERNPADTDTHGVGTLIRAAINAGAEHLIVGLGGSATNDCGVGMARALGFVFTDETGEPVTGGPRDFHRIHNIIRPPDWIPPKIIAACDVRNPLLGPRGATRVYGPQKGLRPEDADILEQGHRRVAEAVTRCLGSDLAEVPGAGAAGGLGFGLMAFCNATLAPGFDCLAQATGLEGKIRTSSLVVTGEGSLDAQTLDGKAPYGVATLARRHNIPVVAIAGSIDDTEPRLHDVFDAMTTLVPGPIPLDQACQNAAHHLQQATTRLAKAIHIQLP